MITLLSVLTVAFIFINLNITNAQGPCRTPDNKIGKCIVLQECRALYQQLAGPLSTEQHNFLRKSQCGHDGTQPLVCCPNSFTIDDLPSNGTCGVHSEIVIGGERAYPGQFPWNALLHYKRVSAIRREGFFCGGTLIHESYVLTAAHCINGIDIVRTGYVLDSVRLGEDNLRTNLDCEQFDIYFDPVEDIPIAEAIVHENYVSTSRSQANDIALIRLQRPAPYTEFIRPICLPIADDLRDKNYDGVPMVIVGFGRSINASRSDVRFRREGEGFNLDQCSSIYQSAAINRKQLCAGNEKNEDLCSKDSGGPLIVDHFENVTENGRTHLESMYLYLVGIASFGPAQCGTPGFPGVYTRVDQYIDWILDHMRR